MSRQMMAKPLLGAAALMVGGLLIGGAGPADTIRLGLSLPLSGGGAIWGKGTAWMCDKAAAQINKAGGVNVQGKVYKVACVAYDNKYTAAGGASVAHTLLDRDGIKYVLAMGTAPILATQSLTERQGDLLFNLSWGKATKGPKFPLTFDVFNSPAEIGPAIIKFIAKTYSSAKTVVMLNVDDATGRETEAIMRPMWKKAGYRVLASMFYERGTTEFQPTALRLASYKADIIDLPTLPPPDAGKVLKDLQTLGVKGVKILDDGTSASAVEATSGRSALDGVYMGAAIPIDGPSFDARQRAISKEAKAAFGDPVNLVNISGYDAMQELVAGIEKAQSLNPHAIAKALPTVHFKSFYGDVGFGGAAAYGANIQPLLPVYVTQVVNGKLVDRAKVAVSGK